MWSAVPEVALGERVSGHIHERPVWFEVLTRAAKLRGRGDKPVDKQT